MEGSSRSSEIKIDIENLIDKAKSKQSRRKQSSTIPKIPESLRKILTFHKWNDPTIISIGPYYHGLSNLQEAENFKPAWAHMFVTDSKQQFESLHEKIEKNIVKLGSYYDKENLKYDNKQLTQMFLLDGCVLLYFIRCFGSASKEAAVMNSNLTNHHIAHIQQDLFLLENQLPFEVLKLLFEGAEFDESNHMEEMIIGFITSMITMARGKSETNLNINDSKPCHLLDLFRGFLLGKWKKISKPEDVTSETQHDNIPASHDRKKQGKNYFQSLLGSISICNKAHERRLIRPSNRSHNVQELKATGVRFKPNKTGCMADISFTSSGITGCLKLPPVTINAFTMIIFVNLVAQESLSNLNDFTVSSFLCFLDSLIDSWEDVKELQAARVLHNFLGDKKEVAHFFNHVCGKLMEDVSVYKDVKQKIQKHVDGHYNSKLRKWFIEFKHTYFRSPWSVIALVAALIGLLLGVVQTYASVLSLSKH